MLLAGHRQGQVRWGAPTAPGHLVTRTRRRRFEVRNDTSGGGAAAPTDVPLPRTLASGEASVDALATTSGDDGSLSIDAFATDTLAIDAFAIDKEDRHGGVVPARFQVAGSDDRQGSSSWRYGPP